MKTNMTREEMRDAVIDLAIQNKKFSEVREQFSGVAEYALIKWYNTGKMIRAEQVNIRSY